MRARIGVLTTLLLAGFLMQAEDNEPPRQLSVAEVVNNAEANSGRAITVEGLLSASTEFTALKGDGCNTRMNPLKKPFACAIDLVFPSCKAPAPRCTAALVDVLNVIRSQGFSRAPMQITLRLTGRVIAPQKVFVKDPLPPPVPGWPEGKYVEMGFGHMNAFPVQLTVMDGRIVSQMSPPVGARQR